MSQINPKLFIAAFILLLPAGLILWGCGKTAPVSSNSGSGPTVVSVLPVNGAASQSTDISVEALFSESMESGSVSSSNFVLSSSLGTVTAAVSYSASSLTAKLVPSSRLANNTVYTAAINTAVKNLSGIPMARESSWTFTTRTATSSVYYQKNGSAVEDFLGYSVDMSGDVNNDDYADFIIGAYGADPNGGNSAGSAYVFSGKDGGLLYQKDGGSSGDQFGYSAAGAGDVNNDGYSDFIIGAFLADPNSSADAGSAYVYSGKDGSLLYQKNGGASGDRFGHSVAGAGDVNNDGYADFIIGAYFADPNSNADAGSAYVYSGKDGSLLYQKNGAAGLDYFGFSVAGAGDINADGCSDFVVGAYLSDSGANNAGSVYVYSGKDGSLLHQKNGAADSDYMGYSVSEAGDVNGDGYSDFISGAYFADPGGKSSAGSAYVYSGKDGSLLYQKDGAAETDYFGGSVATAGDVNGDGRSDFIISAFGADPDSRTGAGSVYVYSGSDGSLLRQIDGSSAADFFGISVAGGEDVNKDGKPDIIVGAYFADPGGYSKAGSAYVFRSE